MQCAVARRGTNCLDLQPSMQAVGGAYLPSGKWQACVALHLLHAKFICWIRGFTVLIRTTVPLRVTSLLMQLALSRRTLVSEVE